MQINEVVTSDEKAELPRYLCDKHLAETILNPGKACLTWVRLIKAGNCAFKSEQWDAAHRNFGAAYDIARAMIRTVISDPGHFYAAERLLIASHNLSVTMAHQDMHTKAVKLLVHMHRDLLVLCNDESLRPDTRAAALGCLEPSLERIKCTLSEEQNPEFIEELTSLTQNTCNELRSIIFH